MTIVEGKGLQTRTRDDGPYDLCATGTWLVSWYGCSRTLLVRPVHGDFFKSSEWARVSDQVMVSYQHHSGYDAQFCGNSHNLLIRWSNSKKRLYAPKIAQHNSPLHLYQVSPRLGSTRPSVWRCVIPVQ